MLRAVRAAKAQAMSSASPFLQLLVVPGWVSKACQPEYLRNP